VAIVTASMREIEADGDVSFLKAAVLLPISAMPKVCP
jgi:hypothetical protein